MRARLRLYLLVPALCLTIGAAWAQSTGSEAPKPSTAASVSSTVAISTSNTAASPVQTSAPTNKGPDFVAMGADFRNPKFWQALLVALVAGGLGGLIYELLILQGQIELPHKTTAEEAVQATQVAIWKFTFDLGIFSRIIIGSFAAVAVLWVLAPPSGFALLAVSLIAGSAGSSIFRSLEDRLLAVVSQKNAAETRKKADTLNEKVEAADKSVANAQAKLSPAPGAGLVAALPPGHAGALADLQDASRAIADAKAVYLTIKQ